MNHAAAQSFQSSMSRFLLPILAATVGLQFLLVLVIAVGMFVPLGWRIPTSNIFSDYLIASVVANLFLPVFFILPIPIKHRRMLAIAWCIRCIVALGVSLFYESWYGLDAYSYFASSAGASLTELFNATGFGRGNENIIFLTKLFTLYLPDNSYHAAKIFFALIGQFSAYFFYRSLMVFNFGKESKVAFWFLTCFPSALFWSSILGKDPLVLLGLSIYAIGLAYFTTHKRFQGLVYVMAGLIIASSIRTWLFPLFFTPVLLVTPLLLFSSRLPRLAFIILTIGLGFIVVPVFLQRYGITSSGDLINYLNRFSRAWARGGSSQTLPQFESIFSLVAFFPLGSFTALFRPLLGEVMNPFGIAAGLENILLLFMVTWIAYRSLQGSLKVYRYPALALISIIAIWSAVYGFVSYQNLGTAFRFRAQILPFVLVFFFLACSRGQRPSSIETY